jgi:hypothetical protein
MRRQREIWWLNPLWVAGISCSVISVCSYLLPESLYRSFWRTPKFFGLEQLGICLAFTAVFVLGAAATSKGRREHAYDGRAWVDQVPWKSAERLFWFCFVSAVVGYVAWAVAAIERGASLALALDVLRGEPGAVYEMKEVYLVTISGVTTLTQMGIVCVVLGVMIGIARGWRKVVVPITVLFLLAVIRALFNAERLAIIELAVPMTVLMIHLLVAESDFWARRHWRLLQAIPIVAAIGLLVMFGTFEYFRSWSTFYAGGDLSFLQFTVIRLLGYYVTALNNGVLLVSRLDPVAAPVTTLHFMWRFPVLKDIADSLFGYLPITDPAQEPYMAVLDREANPEFNNGSALLAPVIDFGYAGAMLFWLCAGLLVGLLYRWFSEKRLAGLALFPIFFVGVTELARIMYWGEGRVVVAYVVLIPFVWASSYWYRRALKAERRTA